MFTRFYISLLIHSHMSSKSRWWLIISIHYNSCLTSPTQRQNDREALRDTLTMKVTETLPLTHPSINHNHDIIISWHAYFPHHYSQIPSIHLWKLLIHSPHWPHWPVWFHPQATTGTHPGEIRLSSIARHGLQSLTIYDKADLLKLARNYKTCNTTYSKTIARNSKK